MTGVQLTFIRSVARFDSETCNCAKWSVGVLAARVVGIDEDRVQFPNGPLDDFNGLACSKGATDPCKIGVKGSIPFQSTPQRSMGANGRKWAPGSNRVHEILGAVDDQRPADSTVAAFA